MEALLRIGDREDHRDVGDRSVRDEGLGAVDAPAVAVAFRPRAHREGVRARTRLGDRVCADQGAVAQAAEIARLLRVVAVLPDRHHAGQQMGGEREHQTAVLAAVTQGFEHDRGRQRVEAGAAVFLRHRQALDADLGTLLPQVAGESLIAVAIGDVTVEFALGEADRIVAQQFLFFGEGEVHQASSLRRW